MQVGFKKTDDTRLNFFELARCYPNQSPLACSSVRPSETRCFLHCILVIGLQPIKTRAE